MLSVITVIMALCSAYVPVLGNIAALLWPLPIVVLVVRHGLRWGIMAVAVSGVVMTALLGPAFSVVTIMTFAFVGLMLGVGYQRHWAAARCFMMALLVSAISTAAAFAFGFLVTGIDPTAIFSPEQMEKAYNATVAMYEDMGTDTTELIEKKETMLQMLGALHLLLPSMILGAAALVAALNFFVGGRVLRHLGYSVTGFPLFEDWRLPQVFVYLLGFSLVGLYWGNSRHIELLTNISLNVDMIANFAGFIQGLSLLYCLLKRFHVSHVLTVVLLCVAFLTAYQVVAFIGLFDMIFDYRRRFSNRGGNSLK